MALQLAKGLCVKCNDGKLKPVVGKREKALCPSHYQQKLREPKEGAEPKQRTPIVRDVNYKIPKKSEKQKELDAQYAKDRKVFMDGEYECEMKFACCIGKATEVHHDQGRIGGRLLDTSGWVRACKPCHEYERTHPEEAKAKGVIKSRIGKHFIR